MEGRSIWTDPATGRRYTMGAGGGTVWLPAKTNWRWPLAAVALAGVLGLCLLVGIAVASSRSGGSADVPWSDYAPAVKQRIDAMAAARDCGGLQGEFNAADRNDDATRAARGHGNAVLMDYIDEQLRAAHCYG